ncbi:IS66 family insertion sequence element accessory protein TnpA, partial [Thiolapillus sp.]
MAPTDTTFWQDHVTTWQASDLTQKAYCEAHGLRYATFGYWVRKLR